MRCKYRMYYSDTLMTLFLLVLDSCRIFNGIIHYVKSKVEWTKIYVLAYVKFCKVLNIYVCFDFISFRSNLFLNLPNVKLEMHVLRSGNRAWKCTKSLGYDFLKNVYNQKTDECHLSSKASIDVSDCWCLPLTLVMSSKSISINRWSHFFWWNYFFK